MPEPRHNANSQLRAYLHADLADFVETYESKALRDGDTALASCVRTVHQARLDGLLEGRKVGNIRRYSLPPWHPESTRYGGNIYDTFELDEHDVLRRELDSPPPPVLPNRKQRRAGGFRGPLNGNRNGQG